MIKNIAQTLFNVNSFLKEFLFDWNNLSTQNKQRCIQNRCIDYDNQKYTILDFIQQDSQRVIDENGQILILKTVQPEDKAGCIIS